MGFLVIGMALGAAGCETNPGIAPGPVPTRTTPRLASPTYVAGSRLAEQEAAIAALVERVPAQHRARFEQLLRDTTNVFDGAPDAEAAKLLKTIYEIRQADRVAARLHQSRELARTQRTQVFLALSSEQLPAGIAARVIRRRAVYPTNVILLDPTVATSETVAAALVVLRDLRSTEGDIVTTDSRIDVSVATGIPLRSAQRRHYSQVVQKISQKAPKNIEALGSLRYVVMGVKPVG